MSSNNVVWVMPYRGYIHVFYSGCIDNTPTKPDVNDKYYKLFGTRSGALMYAHNVVDKIDKESWNEGFPGVEYGVCEVPLNYADNKLREIIHHIDKITEEWKREIKDLQFSVEQFEAWKKKLLEN